MRRREFIAASGVLLAGNLYAQPPARVARVGILFPGTAETSAFNQKALTEGLATLGWTVGRNVAIEPRFADNLVANLPQLAADLVRSKVEVVVCSGPAAAMALKSVGAQTPVVFVVVADPVKLGLAASLSRPGGTFTGLATLNPEFFFAKQIQLLHEIVPRATRIAFLANPDNPITHLRGRESGIRIAKDQGLQAIAVEARTREEITPAFAAAAAQKAGLIYVQGDSLFMGQRPLVAELALRHKLASMFLFYQHVDEGGLMSYGIDVAAFFRQSAGYVDKILKGAPPGDLPIEEPSKYMLVINLKTAKALGIRIPQSVLLRADRVIE